MSHTTFESDDGVLSQDQICSPLMDKGKSGGSADGGLALKKGPWTSAEDAILVDYVKKHGEGNWNAVQKYSGLSRCGKSCRLRWANHLRPNLKKGAFSAEEERLIVELHAKMGNKWARMAAHVINGSLFHLYQIMLLVSLLLLSAAFVNIIFSEIKIPRSQVRLFPPFLHHMAYILCSTWEVFSLASCIV